MPDYPKLAYINTKLKREYGSDKLNGRQMFRVIWSDDEFENRRSIFRDYTESGLFLREVNEVRKCYKYPYRHRYIIEKSNDIVLTNEILEHNGYEAIWVFEEKLELSPKAIFMFCHWAVTGSIARGKNISEYTDEQEVKDRLKEFEEEAKFFEDYFLQSGGDMGIGYGEAVSYSGLDAKKVIGEQNG